jgi:hypothetical protein
VLTLQHGQVVNKSEYQISNREPRIRHWRYDADDSDFEIWYSRFFRTRPTVKLHTPRQ